MLGRDIEGKGFIELNFFNLFWVFVVCCFLGLIIETIYHMVVVEPGVYQDRAGLLFGPFSPDRRFRRAPHDGGAQPLLQGEPHHHLRGERHHRRPLRGGDRMVHAGGFRRHGVGLQRLHDLRPLPRSHRRDLRRPHEHALHVHVGCARVSYGSSSACRVS